MRIAMHDDLLHEAFRRFDVDNSGKISLDNCRQVLGESYEGASVEEIFREVPHDGNEIEYKEFVKYLRNQGADESHQDVAAAVIDTELAKKAAAQSDESQCLKDSLTRGELRPKKDGEPAVPAARGLQQNCRPSGEAESVSVKPNSGGFASCCVQC